MKEFTNSAGNVTSFAENKNFLFLAGNHTQGPDLKGFGKICENIYTLRVISFKEKAAMNWREVTFMKEWVKPRNINSL